MAEMESTADFKNRFRHSYHEQSFLFRLWMGILIGINIGFIMLTLNVLTNSNNTIRSSMPLYEGITFMIVGAIDVYFMIKLLKFRKFGLYGTVFFSFINVVLNIMWDSAVLWPLVMFFASTAVILAFVLPVWRKYE